MTKTKIYEDIISEILKEEDEKHALHQASFIYYHGNEDIVAKHIYNAKVEICKRIRKEIILRERQ